MDPQRWVQQRWGSRRFGFSLIELIMALLLISVLTAIAFPQFSRYMNRRSVLNARDAFSTVSARARAAAIERGDIVMLVIDPTNDRVRVDTVAGAAPLEVLDLTRGDMRADLLMASTATVCYTPRGFAHPACSSELPDSVRFALGRDTLRARITSIGKVEQQ